MNILFLLTNYPAFGGIETVTNTLVDYLGTKHNIYSLAHHFMEDATVPKCLKQYFVYKSKELNGKIQEYNHLVEKLDIDLVINQEVFHDSSPIIFNSNRHRNVKIIFAMHGMPGYEKSEYIHLRDIQTTSQLKKWSRHLLIHFGLHKRCNRYQQVFRKYDRIAAIEGNKVVMLSKSYIRPFIKKNSLSAYASKITSIPNPIPDTQYSHPVPQWEHKENIIMFAGRLSWEKRVQIILKIWDNLSREPYIQENLKKWKLVIVGDGKERKELEDTAEKLQLKNYIFAGTTNEVDKYYSKAKIILLTSKFESFGMVLLEAQKFGCVPVSFDTSGGIRDILDNGSGIIVRQDDIKAMTRRIAELIASPDILRSYSQKAIANPSRFSIETVGPMWDRLIEEVAKPINPLNQTI